MLRSFFDKFFILLSLFALSFWTLLIAGCYEGNNNSDDTGYVSDTGEVWTAEGKASISNTYYLPFHSGERYSATTYSGHGEAWDFNKTSDCGEPVIATASGYVQTAVSTCDSCTTGYGNYVLINHDSDSYYSRYGHLNTVYVVSGQWVERGQAIGTIGTTGNSTGCHLHFQVENSSGTSYGVKFRYSSSTGYLSNGSSYTSTNQGKIDSARTRNGSSSVGSATTSTSTRVASEGFATYYSGGSYGSCAIYYQGLGCNGGDNCPSYNNTSYAWLVRSGFYSYYSSCGGPSYCWLGFPTGDEYTISGGSQQNFENGYLLYSTRSGGGSSVTAYSY